MEQDTLTRSAYLEGKKVLTDDDIANLIEIHNEYPDVKTLKRYTDKKYRELNTDERTELITSLLNDEEYLQYKNCHIAKSKLLYDADSTLIKEIETLSKLNDLGYEIYLLPYGYARDDMNCFKKSADSITEGDFLEIKQVISTNDRAGQGTYEDSRKQADNVFMSIKYDVPEEKIINNIHRSIGNIKKGNKEKGIENNFEGLIFLHFEQTGNTSLYQVSREGRVNKLESANIEVFKKIKGTAYDSSQVVENPMTEHGSSRNSNIAQNEEKSNQKSSEGRVNENVSLSKPITIVVTQYDEQHNPITDNNGNPVTATLHCNKGLGVALGTLVHRNAVLERDNELLRKQLNMYKTNDISQADDSSWSD